METRKVTIVVEVPKMFSETDVRDVFYTLRWKVVSVSEEAAQQGVVTCTCSHNKDGSIFVYSKTCPNPTHVAKA